MFDDFYRWLTNLMASVLPELEIGQLQEGKKAPYVEPTAASPVVSSAVSEPHVPRSKSIWNTVVRLALRALWIQVIDPTKDH